VKQPRAQVFEENSFMVMPEEEAFTPINPIGVGKGNPNATEEEFLDFERGIRSGSRDLFEALSLHAKNADAVAEPLSPPEVGQPRLIVIAYVVGPTPEEISAFTGGYKVNLRVLNQGTVPVDFDEVRFTFAVKQGYTCSYFAAGSSLAPENSLDFVIRTEEFTRPLLAGLLGEPVQLQVSFLKKRNLAVPSFLAQLPLLEDMQRTTKPVRLPVCSLKIKGPIRPACSALGALGKTHRFYSLPNSESSPKGYALSTQTQPSSGTPHLYATGFAFRNDKGYIVYVRVENDNNVAIGWTLFRCGFCDRKGTELKLTRGSSRLWSSNFNTMDSVLYSDEQLLPRQKIAPEGFVVLETVCENGKQKIAIVEVKVLDGWEVKNNFVALLPPLNTLPQWTGRTDKDIRKGAPLELCVIDRNVATKQP
jgi:hypothetical protein